jgi:hypothetical protein
VGEAASWITIPLRNGSVFDAGRVTVTEFVLNLMCCAEWVANIKGIIVEKVLEVTRENAQRMFGINVVTRRFSFTTYFTYDYQYHPYQISSLSIPSKHLLCPF